MFMLDISLDLEALHAAHPEVVLSESCTEGTGGQQVISTLFNAIPSEESTWSDTASLNNSPF